VNRPSKRLNVGLLMAVLAIAATTVIAITIVHRIQVSRNAGALASLARIKKSEGNSTDAIGLFSRYLSYRPDDAEAQAELARLLIDFAEQPTATKNNRLYAYAVLETAVRKNPDDLPLRQRLAEWMLRFGRFGDATRELNTLRERVVTAGPSTTAEDPSDKDPSDKEVLDLDAIDVLRARALIGRREFQEAAAIVATIIGFDLEKQAFDAGEASEKTGENARKASLTLATLLAEKLESPQAAAIVLKHLADADPKDTQAWLALARWYQTHGDLAKAAAAVRTAAKLAPDNPEVLFSDLELSIAEKRYDVAEQLAAKARKLFPTDEPAVAPADAGRRPAAGQPDRRSGGDDRHLDAGTKRQTARVRSASGAAADGAKAVAARQAEAR
jgi:cytochrome c-type biogenesis protein CcmH/NrfG